MSNIARGIAGFSEASASDIDDREASEEGAALIRGLIRKNWGFVSSSAGASGVGTMIRLAFQGGWSIHAWIRDDGRFVDGHITAGGAGGTFGFFGPTRIEKVLALWEASPIQGERLVILPEQAPEEGEPIPGWKPVPVIGPGQVRVEFFKGRDGRPAAQIEGRYMIRHMAFPERKGPQPRVGEVWVVEITGENPRRTVFSLRLVKKIR